MSQAEDIGPVHSDGNGNDKTPKTLNLFLDKMSSPNILYSLENRKHSKNK